MQRIIEESLDTAYLKDYLIILACIVFSFLIFPAFIILGYAVNAMSHSHKENFMEYVTNRTLTQQAKEGFFFAVFQLLVSLLIILFFSIMLAVLSLLFGLEGVLASMIILLLLLIPFIFLGIALNVSYAKERSVLGAFSIDNITTFMSSPNFYIYAILGIIINAIASATFLAAGWGLIVSFGLYGAIIESENGNRRNKSSSRGKRGGKSKKKKRKKKKPRKKKKKKRKKRKRKKKPKKKRKKKKSKKKKRKRKDEK